MLRREMHSFSILVGMAHNRKIQVRSCLLRFERLSLNDILVAGLEKDSLAETIVPVDYEQVGQITDDVCENIGAGFMFTHRF